MPQGFAFLSSLQAVVSPVFARVNSPVKRQFKEFPVMAQRKQTWLASMRTQVWSLALLSGLRIWHCCELWYRSQTQLGSDLALLWLWCRPAVRADLTPSLETSICCECSPKKTKKRKKKKSLSSTLLEGFLRHLIENILIPCLALLYLTFFFFLIYGLLPLRCSRHHIYHSFFKSKAVTGTQ